MEASEKNTHCKLKIQQNVKASSTVVGSDTAIGGICKAQQVVGGAQLAPCMQLGGSFSLTLICFAPESTPISCSAAGTHLLLPSHPRRNALRPSGLPHNTTQGMLSGDVGDGLQKH